MKGEFGLEPDFVQNAAFHDQLAPRYDEHLAISKYNTLAREAFVNLVAQYVSPGCSLLDFGCGTGIDALQYAQRGYSVFAYDNSPGMVAQLERRCRPEIASGAITAWSEGYASFLRHFPPSAAVSAVVANFAVLNSIRELAPLFDLFARHLAPPGWMIVSILNPLHWQKVKTPRWWLKALRDRDGSPAYSHQPYATYLHFVPAVLRAASQFHLVGRANAGRFVRYDAGSGRAPVWWGQSDAKGKLSDRALWRTPAHRMLGHFVFLVLRRDPL